MVDLEIGWKYENTLLPNNPLGKVKENSTSNLKLELVQNIITLLYIPRLTLIGKSIQMTLLVLM